MMRPRGVGIRVALSAAAHSLRAAGALWLVMAFGGFDEVGEEGDVSCDHHGGEADVSSSESVPADEPSMPNRDDHDPEGACASDAYGIDAHSVRRRRTSLLGAADILLLRRRRRRAEGTEHALEHYRTSPSISMKTPTENA